MWDKQKEVFLPSTPGLGMHVEVKDPEGKVGPPRGAIAYCVRPRFGRAPWACGARRTGAVRERSARPGLSPAAVLQVVLSRQYGSEGRFTFTSHTPGDHQICLHSNSTRMALFAGGRLVRGLFWAASWILTWFQSFDLSLSSFVTLYGLYAIVIV